MTDTPEILRRCAPQNDRAGGSLNQRAVVTQTTANGQTTSTTHTLDFTYDASGSPMAVSYDGTTYYYALNLQGDVLAILDGSGNRAVYYVYDAWGNVQSITGTMASTLGQYNPLRYRGYVFDTETKLYYLQSRYYDPAIGRFLNADAFASTGQGILGNNMFAYCSNNPVVRTDYSGMCWTGIWDGIKSFIRNALHTVNSIAICFGMDTAGIGASALDMYESSPGVYHANTDCWQQYFGYNSVYDAVFDMGTSMDTQRFEFVSNGEEYCIWMWKGDYVNLGAGAEMGIYYGGGPHWFVDTGLAMPMSMSLECNGSTIISHSQSTWWITGFNSNYLNIQASDLTVSFTIFFNNSGMYNAFSRSWAGIGGWICNPNNYSATIVF